ncbi:hypothetical protein B0H14DRAFT_3522898 [Mycena olivaceomarginata]|nr:hypothetical protein B0H14DRAFT_3522898 [Mycena olivaceomarginata]
MRLMDRDAWQVKDAASVVEGVDLLKNRREVPLRTLDGRVAAYIVVGNTSYFVTTNAHYVPLLPPINPAKIMVRRDMRYGPDDPVLWPHLFSETFCHLAAIPKAPTHSRNPDGLALMWWNPTHDDLVCPETGMTLTRGLGRLVFSQFSKFSVRVQALMEEYEQYSKSLPVGATVIPLFPRLVLALRLSLERLRIPTTYTRMRIGVVSVQREVLELTGLLRYMQKYKPRMEGIRDPDANPAQPDACLGCFTDDPRVAQAFWQACLPCWLLRPLRAFSDENILRVVAPFQRSITWRCIQLQGSPQ